MTALLSHPFTSGSCLLVSRINKTTPGGINAKTQLRLDQLLANWLRDQVVFILSAYIIPDVEKRITCKSNLQAFVRRWPPQPLALINQFNNKSVLDHFHFLHNWWLRLLRCKRVIYRMALIKTADPSLIDSLVRNTEK